MANANSENECKKEYDDAVKILRTRCSNGHVSINVLKELYEERNSFSQFSIRNIPCSRGRRGSTCSESNHSSIIIHLNGGQRSVSEYTEHPATMFRDLLIRQSYHIKKWNSELFNQENRMKVELNRLMQSSPRNVRLEKAASYLCMLSYYRFKDASSRTEEYVSQMSEDEEGNVECIVQSKRYDDAPPRRFKLESDGFFSRCTCHNRVSFQEQCVHEILVYEGFVHLLFAEWHKRRSCVTCSDAVEDTDKETICDFSGGSPNVNDGLSQSLLGNNPFKSIPPKKDNMAISYSVSVNNEFSSALSLKQNSSDITYSEWQKVQREVDGAFMNAGKETKTKVMALQLEIRNALHLDGNIEHSNLFSDEEGSSSKIDSAFHRIVVNYRKSFTPLKGNFNPVKRSLVIPNRHVRSRQPNKRLMPMSERICRDFKKAKKIKPTCGFCRQENHRILTCPKKEELKCLGEEFVLFNDTTAKYHLQHLLENLERCRNVMGWDYRLNAHSDIDTSRGFKHIIIHQSFSFVDCYSEPRVNIRSMFFRIAFLDGSGNEKVEDGAMYFTGEGLERYLYNATKRSRQGKVFVYNRCNSGAKVKEVLGRTPESSQIVLKSTDNNWFPLYQQVTPDDNVKESSDMLRGQCLDMNDY